VSRIHTLLLIYEKPMLKSSTRVAALMLSAALSGASTIASAQAPVQRLVPSQTILPAPLDNTVPDQARLVQLAANGRHYRDGTYTGPSVDAYYGLVQVQANIQGGRLISVEVLQYPSDRRTSRAINTQALPILESEVISAQSTRVDTVTGATLTSAAYLRSMGEALHQAGG